MSGTRHPDRSGDKRRNPKAVNHWLGGRRPCRRIDCIRRLPAGERCAACTPAVIVTEERKITT